jgi:sulfur carrier protein ThiS
MRIYLGGHLSFYHPQKESWLEVDIIEPAPLITILEEAGVPVGEVQLVTVNGEIVDLQNTVIYPDDVVKLFSAVGGG